MIIETFLAGLEILLTFYHSFTFFLRKKARLGAFYFWKSR